MKARPGSKTRKIVLRSLTIVVGLIFILSAILAIHIYQVTKNKKHNPTQLSRIDFSVKPDSAEAVRAQSIVASLPGVVNTLFNIKDGILVYTYNSEKQNSDFVFRKLMQKGNYQAKKYQVSQKDLQTGCPIGAEKRSFSGKLFAGIQSLFQ